MTIRLAWIAGIVALTASTSGLTQSDEAFSASGASCDRITWSQESLRRFPFIASACQEVMLRDGKYYVRFEGDVERVADGGRELLFDFEGGEEVTLYPPEGMTVNLDGRATRVRDLQRGDHLSLYVPQARLEEHVFQGEIAPPPPAPVAAAAPPPAPRPAPAAPPRPEPAPAAAVVEGDEVPTETSIPMLVGIGIALVVVVVGGLLLRRRK